jgi:hypothetical protein
MAIYHYLYKYGRRSEIAHTIFIEEFPRIKDPYPSFARQSP